MKKICIASLEERMQKMRIYKHLLMFPVFGIFILLAIASASTPDTSNTLDIPAPVFDKPHAIVLDMWSYGSRRYEDYVKVYNATLHEQVSFNVFGYDVKNSRWVLIGPAILKKVTDRDTIDSPLNGELNRFRWFAIHSLNNLDFNAQAVINRNDILITVFEEGLKDW